MAGSSYRSKPQVTTAFVPEAGATPFPGYRLTRVRGRGGFATVWECDSPTGKPIALKFMAAGSNATTTSREVRSLQAVQSLDHPHLLRIHNVWSLSGHIVIGMDLADASLLDLLQLYLEDLGHHIEPEKVFRYLAPIAAALDFLNARRHRLDGRLVGFQHGDVKPNNILLIGDHPMLADYGLAIPTATAMTPCPRSGTVEYCPPELFQGHLTDRSDQFSFAVTYFVLRTGRLPFPTIGRGPSELKDYRRPDPDLTALPMGERPAVARALSPASQQRFPSCVDFLSAVVAAHGQRLVRDDEAKTIRVEG